MIPRLAAIQFERFMASGRTSPALCGWGIMRPELCLLQLVRASPNVACDACDGSGNLESFVDNSDILVHQSCWMLCNSVF